MWHSPVLRHGDDCVVHLVLRMRGDANQAWRGCVALRQAGFGVPGGNEEGAKIVVGEIGYFLADDNDEVEEPLKPSLSILSGPEPGVTVANAGDEAGKRIISPCEGPESGVKMLGVVRGNFLTW